MAAVLAMGISVPRHVLPLHELARARNVDPAKYRLGLGCKEMAVVAPGEDTVTLAAEATLSLLQNAPEYEPSKIGLLVVGTESGVDRAKPVAIWVHNLLGLSASCEVFDVKHACFGGTAALRMASLWADANPGRLALVVASDIARYPLNSPGEPTQGAGAVALLLGSCGRGEEVFTLSKRVGMYAAQVDDFWQPAYLKEAVVRGHYSISCYIESLKRSLEDYGEEPGNDPDFLVFHCPFPKMVKKAHAAMLEFLGKSYDVSEDFRRRVEPTLWVNERVGNAYTASVFLSLCGLIEALGGSLIGRTVGVFSYGSGSCAEYAVYTFGNGVKTSLDIKRRLDSREVINATQYERMRAECEALEQNGSYKGNVTNLGRFTFMGIQEHRRVYCGNNLRPE